jgi:hypothetical protein
MDMIKMNLQLLDGQNMRLSDGSLLFHLKLNSTSFLENLESKAWARIE